MSNLPTTPRPVALITGASRGIGEAIARELGLRGYALVLAARSAGALNELATSLGRAGIPALPVPTDMADPAAVQQLAQTALKHYGRVDVLVNNAGIDQQRTISAASDDEVAQMLGVNLVAPIALTRALLPQMVARRSGAVVLIGSVAGFIGLPGSALYSTTKFGLRGFADTLRREVRHQGIQVLYTAPGFIATDMTARMRALPMPGPESVARAMADALLHKRRVVVTPGYYRLLIVAARVFPRITDLLMNGRVRWQKG